MTIFIGTAGDDSNFAAWNTMYGLDGNDYLLTSTGFGEVDGGSGSDFVASFNGASGVSLYGGDGGDIVMTLGGSATSYQYGGFDSDLLVGDNVDHASPAGGQAQQLGVNASADYMEGGQGVDAMYGFGGNDIMYGGDDSDSGTITVNAGNAGGDQLTAFVVAAGLFGGDGADYLDGGQGNDCLAVQGLTCCWAVTTMTCCRAKLMRITLTVAAAMMACLAVMEPTI
jgi:Ca2+-binding RTX toxin-like protein